MLIVPTVSGPAILTLQNDNLTADSNITIPANSYPMQIICENIGSSSHSVNFELDGVSVASFSPAVGQNFNNILKSISDADRTMSVTSADWTGMELNLSIIVIRVF